MPELETKSSFTPELNFREIQLPSKNTEALSVARLLWHWRNDPITRANSIHSSEIPWEVHLNWLEKSITNPNKKIWLCYQTVDRPVGTLRFDQDPQTNTIELSWTIAPDVRGLGFGKRMLKLGIEEGLHSTSSNFLGWKPKCIIAQIRKTNIASQKMAIFAGFKLLSQTDGGGILPEIQVWQLTKC